MNVSVQSGEEPAAPTRAMLSMSDDALRPGTVTKLTVQKKNKERVSVFIDGTFAFGVHQDLVLTFDLRQGRSLTVAEQEEIQAADEVEVAKAAAFNYIAHRDRTEHEVRTKLEEKNFSGPVIEQVVERLYELDFLDDAAYAERYARERFERKGYGPRRIRHELRRRGVGSYDIEDAAAEVFDREDALDNARQHAEKRLSRLEREPDPWRRREKLSGYLLRRGFGYDTVRQVVDEMAEREGW